jgi:SulP family sulfate permease
MPQYIYAIFGTSRQLAIGPMAITSLLLGVSVQQNYGYDEQSSQYINAMMNISMIVGFVIFILGMLRLGILANLISPSVLSGFLTASALVIALNQLKYLFGIEVPRFEYSVQTIGYILTHLNESNVAATIIGILTCIILYLLKQWRLKNKGYFAEFPDAPTIRYRILRWCFYLSKMSNFFAILIGSLVAYVLKANGHDIAIVGKVPSGLIPPSLITINFKKSIELIPSTFIHLD